MSLKPAKEGLVELANVLIKAIEAEVQEKQENIKFLQSAIDALNRKANWLRREITN